LEDRILKGSRAWISRFTENHERASLLGEALDWLKVGPALRGARVFLKPNLTWTTPTPGVTTSPSFIESVVSRLADWTSRITVGEADGGYHAFKAQEAFAAHGLNGLRSRYGISIVNLSEIPAGRFSTSVGVREIMVELPRFLIEEVDIFVTLPVPKVHIMTGLSLGFKNQWGCQPGTMRLRNHPWFSERVIAINALVRPRLALYDGEHWLDRSGPLSGVPVRLDLVLAADGVGAGDAVASHIMGWPVSRVAHLALAARIGVCPFAASEVTVNRAIGSFCTHQFRLRRTAINWIAWAAFHSDLLTKAFYDSALADPLHRLLYAIRRNPVIGRALYGRVGPPASEGHRKRQ
jgi:uncharacterized protein (DUF362 family)